MRQTKRASKKRSKLAKQAQDTATRIERRYLDAAPTALTAKSSHSVGDFNDGFRQIADEMNTYSVRSMEQVLHAWEQFLDAGPLRQVFEFQTRYAQNAQNAYEFLRRRNLSARGNVSRCNPAGLQTFDAGAQTGKISLLQSAAN